MPAAEVRPIAERLVAALASSCDRIEIAGSLRREKPYVRDIELVAAPLLEERASDDIWGTPETVDRLEGAIASALRAGYIAPREVETHRSDGRIETLTKMGSAFKALVFRGMPVDLFIVRAPATWGCIFALRTGPGDWNTRLVTDCKAIGRRVEGGQVQRWTGSSWAVVATPEEADFFAALGQSWVAPSDRHVQRIRIDRRIADGVAA